MPPIGKHEPRCNGRGGGMVIIQTQIYVSIHIWMCTHIHIGVKLRRHLRGGRDATHRVARA